MQARCSRRNFVKRIKNETRFKSRRLIRLRTSTATTPLDGDRHRAPEPLARVRRCRGTARALPALRLAVDRHVQRRGAGPRLPRLCVERECGMFSAATFAMAMVGVVLYGRMDAVATSFLAGTVSAALFGLASIFRFGPDAA